jgi:hypothetical protein
MAQKFSGQRRSSKFIASMSKLLPQHPYPIRPLPVAQREIWDGPLKGMLEFAPVFDVEDDQ